MALLFCAKCRKTMQDRNFYSYKDGSKCELCKNCLTMHVDNYNPDTFLWILEKFDVPYIEQEWNALRDKIFAKDPTATGGLSMIGRYLSKMKLKQWANFRWADTAQLQLEYDQREQLYGNPNAKKIESIEKMQERYENGEISEAQLQTYVDMKEKEVPPNVTVIGGNVIESKYVEGITGKITPVPAEVPIRPQTQIIQNMPAVDIPDPIDQLTMEDRIYLTTKWGKMYTATDWLWLEQKYKDFMDSFSVQGAARVDTLILICKTSLKLNQAIDVGDMDTYSKLSKTYDSLMKAAKFTEAQRKEEQSGRFDSIGQIVQYAEKEGGKIPRFDISTPLDVVDKAIENLKRYTRELIQNDTSLAQQIENYISRRTAHEEQKKDQEEAEAQGLDERLRKTEDYMEYLNKIYDEKEIDKQS